LAAVAYFEKRRGFPYEKNYSHNTSAGEHFRVFSLQFIQTDSFRLYEQQSS